MASGQLQEGARQEQVGHAQDEDEEKDGQGGLSAAEVALACLCHASFSSPTSPDRLTDLLYELVLTLSLLRCWRVSARAAGRLHGASGDPARLGDEDARERPERVPPAGARVGYFEQGR